MAQRGPHIAYVGTYQPAGSPGIFVLDVDRQTGAATVKSAVAGVTNPSFLALSPNGRFLYAVSEAPGGDGEICAFAVDPTSGALTELGRRSAFGHATCHVAVDPTGRALVAANYGSGSVVLYPVEATGRLGDPPVLIQHHGHSVRPRQSEPHAHSANIDPSGRFVYCPDLGLDRVMVYRLDAAAGTLVPADPPSAATADGAGPRHLAFHPTLDRVYVVDEIDSTVTVFAWERATGGLAALGAVPTLPEGFTGRSSCADIHIDPTGRFLYASNRGHDSIAIFSVDPHSGALAAAGHVPTGGRTPRNFAIDPAGAFLYAENQGSDSIVAFRRDAATGGLEPTGAVLELPTPVCMVFAGP